MHPVEGSRAQDLAVNSTDIHLPPDVEPTNQIYMYMYIYIIIYTH